MRSSLSSIFLIGAFFGFQQASSKHIHDETSSFRVSEHPVRSRSSRRSAVTNSLVRRDSPFDPSAEVELTAQNITWITTPFNPTSVPLAVRSPYISTWLWGGTNDRGGDLTAGFAGFWNGNSLPWCGVVQVDGQAYTWMGVAANCGGMQATQRSLTFTATQSVFVLRAGAVDVTATFLSPITPNDLVRQTLPYSYLSVSASTNDGASHAVKLYTDITGEWASNDWSRELTWTQSTLNNSLLVHEFELLNPIPYGEASDSTLYGQVVYATDVSANTTYQSGASSIIRQEFLMNGALANTADPNYRQISDSQPAFGYAKDFGTVASGTNASALFTVGHYRDPGCSFTATNSTMPNRSLYFMSQYPSLESSLSFFHSDFASVSAMSASFDAQVQADAASVVSAHYADLCAISARQVFSGMEITIGNTISGEYNTSDIMIFMKEIATSNYVNTVDVMSPAWPFFAYINPDMLEYMVRPVIEYSEAYFPNQWAPHDIGKAYPNATGPNQIDAPYYIEESANMLFMALAYTRYSGKTDLIQNHYPIHRQWAEYLVNASQYPIYQASTDDFAGQLTNMTSLAVKGTVGIGCMGALAALLNNTEDATYFTDLSKQYGAEVIASAMASTNDHMKLTYNSPDDTWSSLYNMLPDKVFNLGIFNDSTYQMQAEWYSKQALPYGIPLDSRSPLVKTDFAIWMAGIYESNATIRDIFVEGVWNFLSYGSTGQATPDLYDAMNATSYAFVDRPVIGGVYANLAMHKLQIMNGGTTAVNSSSSSAALTARSDSTQTTAHSSSARRSLSRPFFWR